MTKASDNTYRPTSKFPIYSTVMPNCRQRKVQEYIVLQTFVMGRMQLLVWNAYLDSRDCDLVIAFCTHNFIDICFFCSLN